MANRARFKGTSFRQTVGSWGWKAWRNVETERAEDSAEFSIAMEMRRGKARTENNRAWFALERRPEQWESIKSRGFVYSRIIHLRGTGKCPRIQEPLCAP